MPCLPLFHSFKKLFSRENAAPEDAKNFSRCHVDPPANHHAFHDAIYKDLDGIRPPLKSSRSAMGRVANAMKKKLKPRGEERDIQTEKPGTASARATGLHGIFKYSSADRFAVQVAPGQMVERTRAETEMHILLQSHLKERNGDASIRLSEVLRPADLQRPSWGSRFRPFSRRTAAVDSDETRALLSHPIEGQASGSWSDTSSEASARGAQDAFSGPAETSLPVLPELAPESPRVAPPKLAPPDAASPDDRSVDVSAAPVADIPAIPIAVAVDGGAKIQATVAAVPIQAGTPPRTVAQERVLRFIEERLGWSRLAFFEAIAQESPEVAGYLFAQAERMRTMVDPNAGGDRAFGRSAFPGVLVSNEGENKNQLGARVRYELSEKHSALANVRENGQDVLPVILLETLTAELDRQNQARHPEKVNSAVFPQGLAHALADGSQPPDSARGPCADHLLIPHRCAADPARAAFAGLVGEMLLLTQSSTENKSERYRYITDMATIAEEVQERNSYDEHSWVSTFIPGVEQDYYAPFDSEHPWRINGEATLSTKPQVLEKLFEAACAHLDAGQVDPTSIGPLPLIAYELLAKSLGTTVPQYLKDHEAEVLREVESRQQEVIQKQQANVAAAQHALDEREKHGDRMARLCAEHGIVNEMHLPLLRLGLQTEKVTKAAVDRTFKVSSEHGNQLDAIRKIQEDLKKTHCRQSISYKSRGGARDNRCWMRASWMALLIATPPEQLAKLAADMLSESGSGPHTDRPVILEAIGKQFRNDPTQFLHGSRPAREWPGSLEHPAHLGGSLLSDTNGAHIHGREKLNGSTTENWLFELQKAIATEFRWETPSVMHEVFAFGCQSPASSDLPIMLHRAFNTPAMVVEVGVPTIDTNGAYSTMSAQVRIVAPEGSMLAKKISAAADGSITLRVDGEELGDLLEEFKDLPVFWLEHEHFDLYAPDRLIEA